MKRPYVDHIGIIVEDLDKALGLLEGLFQMKPDKVMEMAEVGLRIAHLKAENISIELLQYTGMEGDGIAVRAMGTRNGINHLSLRVGDLDATLKNFQERGINVAEGFPRPGSHGQVAFFQPETTQEILLEICEQPE